MEWAKSYIFYQERWWFSMVHLSLPEGICSYFWHYTLSGGWELINQFFGATSKNGAILSYPNPNFLICTFHTHHPQPRTPHVFFSGVDGDLCEQFMTLSAEKSGVPRVDLLLLRSGSFPVAEVERWFKKKWIWIPWDSSAFFYHHFGWNGWNILFQFFFQASFTTSKSKFLGITLEKKTRGSINLTYEFLCTTRCFRRFYFTARKETFPPMKQRSSGRFPGG